MVVAVRCVSTELWWVSRPVTVGESWNLITASQTLSCTDLLTLLAGRRALPPFPHPNAPAQADPFPSLSAPLASFLARGR